MSLSREIPELLGRAVRPFAAALFASGERDFGRERSRAVFAVHPGGPRIIDTVRDALELDEAQVSASRAVLLRYGNMSSATLPHIFRDVLEDSSREPGTLVAGLAFGPGLTLAGVLLRKE
jgi:predicted naringenin-chalcone synthase